MVTEVARRSLVEWFGAGLRLNRTGVALRIGTRVYIYDEIHQLALTWAGTLLEAAREPLSAVGVLASRSIESYAGLLAVLYAGATVVPLSPDFPLDRTVAMAKAAGVSAVIVDGRGSAAVEELSAALPGLLVLAPTEPVDGCLTADAATALDRPQETDMCRPGYVLFTSGSTGRPKGARVTHANMDHFLRFNQARYGLTPADVLSQTFDQTFDLFMFDVFMAWGSGACLVSTPAQAFVDLPRFVQRNGLTVWFSVPSAIRLARSRSTLTANSMPSLRWSLFCGEPLRAEDAAAWNAAASLGALENLYGPTELTIACSAYRWRPDEPAERLVHGIVPIGQVYAGLDHLLLDGNQAAADEGELCVSGPQTFPGYLDPADDAGRFWRARGRAWYRTGDRVRRLDDGALAYLGRTDHQIKIRGYRVEPAEIEARLRAHPGVDEAVAVLVSPPAGPAVALFHTGQDIPGAEFSSTLAAYLPEFMVPRWFWRLDSLPLNANGKTDRVRLADLAARLADGDRR